MLDRSQSAQSRVERAYAALILLAVLGTTGYALTRTPNFLQVEPDALALRASHEHPNEQAIAAPAAGLVAGTARDADKLAAHYRALTDPIDAETFGGTIYKTFVHGGIRENTSSHCAQSAPASGALD